MANGDKTLPVDVHRESLSRLEPIARESLSARQQAQYDRLTEAQRAGKLLAGLEGPAGIWLRIPEIGAHMMALSDLVRRHIGFDARLTELAILAAARETDSQFIWSLHEPVAKRAGLETEIIVSVRERRPLPDTFAREAAIVALARQAIGAKRVDSAAYAAAIRLFGETATLQLAALIANYAATAIMLAVVDQQLPAGRPPLL